MEPGQEIQLTSESYVIHKSLVPLVIKLVVMTFVLVGVLILLAILITLLDQMVIFKFNFFYLLPVVVVFVLIYGGYTIVLILTWVNDHYVINRHNIIVKRGLFKTAEEYYSVRIIKNIQIVQNMIGKRFDFGDMEVNFLGGRVYLESLPKPYFYEHILRQFHPVAGESKEAIKELKDEEDAGE